MCMSDTARPATFVREIVSPGSWRDSSAVAVSTALAENLSLVLYPVLDVSQLPVTPAMGSDVLV